MIKEIKYIYSNSFNPYENLALEEYLLKTVDKECCILYLWQNSHTIVIGKNQNPWKECNVSEFEKDGGKIVRRLSGGGAVYHDLGNLNFTFILNKDNYNLNKQLSVIIETLELLNIKAKFTGRNDITIDGKKFSGNAFYTSGDNSYHHGTILIDVNINSLSKYLNVSKSKLISKGVDSVKSRVTNLKVYNKDLTIELMKEMLVKGFSKVYGLSASEIKIDDLDSNKLKELTKKFSSWDYIYGRKMEFSVNIEKTFNWGHIDVNAIVDKGKIKECLIYTDSMEGEIFDHISKKLIGEEFNDNIIEKVDNLRKELLKKNMEV